MNPTGAAARTRTFCQAADAVVPWLSEPNAGIVFS
jgi:hypothetical protein